MIKKRKPARPRDDSARSRPRVTLTLAPEEKAAAERMAQARGLPLSTWVGQMIRDEQARQG